MRNGKRAFVAFISMALLLCTALTCFTSCSAKEKKVTYGVMTGSTGEEYARKHYPDAEILCFDAVSDAFTAVIAGKCDYVISAYTNCINYCKNNPELEICQTGLSSELSSIGVTKENTELKEKFNALILQYKESGKLDEIISHWIKTEDEPYDICDVPEASGIETLRVGISANREPMNFILRNEYSGLDIELMRWLAYDLGYKVEFLDMTFSSLITSLTSGKVDAIISNVSMTKERMEIIDFTEGYYYNPQTIVHRKAVGLTELSDLKGRKIGCLTGSTAELALESYYGTDVQISRFNSNTDTLEALINGSVSAIVADSAIAASIIAETPGTYLYSDSLAVEDYAFALSKENTALCEEVSDELTKLKESGFIEAQIAKWIDGDCTEQKLDHYPTSGEKGKLRVAISAETMPYAFVQDNELMGFDVEILSKVASELGYSLEFLYLNFNAVIASVASGNCDIAASNISVTEERKESVLFTVPTNSGRIVAIGMAENANSTGFLEGIIESFDRTFLRENRWQLVLDGLRETVIISVCAAILGTIIGFLFGVARRSARRILSYPVRVILSIFQGTPMVVVLMIFYYIFFGGSDISATIVAILAFGLYFACGVAELLCTGLESVDKGEIEAGTSMGLSKTQIFFGILLPQTVRSMLPLYKNNFVTMMKLTSVVGYIAIQDLTKVSDIIRSRTYESFFPLIATALLYYLAANLITYLLKLVEVKTNPMKRKRRVKGVSENAD